MEKQTWWHVRVVGWGGELIPANLARTEGEAIRKWFAWYAPVGAWIDIPDSSGKGASVTFPGGDTHGVWATPWEGARVRHPRGGR